MTAVGTSATCPAARMRAADNRKPDIVCCSQRGLHAYEGTTSSGCRDPSLASRRRLPRLQRQPYAEGAVDRAHHLALPAQDGRVAAQEAADAAGADREEHRADSAHEHEEEAEDGELRRHGAVAGHHELRQKGEEEERGFGVE